MERTRKMTATELAKRNQKSEQLRVIQVGQDEGVFYVESGEGKICYKVTLNDREVSCTCGDFARGVKSEENFRCKHILSVIKSNVKDIQDGEVLEKRVPKLDSRFVKTIDGREFALYSGLLDLAHQRGLLKIEVEAIQYPTKENEYFAICKAVAQSSSGETFTDVGDCSPANCSSRVAKHLLRMASTRAKARALRDLTNIGMTCLEELDTADLNENGSVQTRKQTEKAPPPSRKPNGGNGKNTRSAKAPTGDDKPKGPTKAPAKEPARETQGTEENKGNGESQESKQENLSGVPKMSEAQKRAVHNLSRRRGISVDEMERMCQESYQTMLENLSSKNAALFIRELQTAA
jgi:hypothetical protein